MPASESLTGEGATVLRAAELLAATASDLRWARMQMAFTLGTHIILVPLGVAWPAITLIANWKGIRKQDPDALLLAQRWSKVMAVTFAVGAVTGTVLTFELGLLWPGLMGRFGDAFGVPFAIEGIFFFLEAIFIAIYIYGWKRLAPWPHFFTGIPIVISGLGGAFAVVSANAWMNQPAGFTLDGAGNVIDVDPLGVIFNQATPYETAHMIVAAYLVGGFLVASVYAVGMLRGRRDRYHRLGFLIPFTVAAIATPIQLFVGDWAARSVFEDQPIKFAAMELVPETSSDVPETLGGFYDEETGEIRGGVEIPGLASLLSGFSTDTEIQGFETVPVEDRPPLNIVHWAWDVMVGIGTALAGLSLWFALRWWRKRNVDGKWFLRAAACAGVASVIALEAGWIVTEVGRQPWVVYEILRTEDAVTDMGGLWISFFSVVAIYAAVITTTVFVVRAMARRWRRADETGEPPVDDSDVPYGPRARSRVPVEA